MLISKRFLPHYNKESGFTITEILIAAFLGILVTSTAYTALIIHQRSVLNDISRTRLSQNLRSAMDFISVDSRQAGEQLPGIFPAIILENGEAEGSDTLTLRRNILSEEFTICSTINAGSSTSLISLVSNDPGTPPVCVYGSQAVALNTWEQHRIKEGGSFKAYIFNVGTRKGEFITVTSTTDSGAQMTLSIENQNLINEYPAYTSVVYAIEEWKYSLDPDNILKITSNEDENDIKNIAFDITNFSVEITLKNNTTVTEFMETENWRDISGIKVTLNGKTSTGKKILIDSLTSTFFPRNILSL
ncbi:MAG TPA: hypothetical protein PKA63_06815 [Oligoflexia bacterium]|nr:hypothetical protein [Oligoflexia bacterium]HMP48361.1 hypothetical protein [Oligoflexia bacterium]